MIINFILKKYTDTGILHKAARTWPEMEKLRENGFETFCRKEYELIRAMGLNENLCREVKAIRKKIGLPENGFSAEEFIAIVSDPEKSRNIIFNTEARFNKLIEGIHAGHTVAPEVSGQLYNLVVCGHAILTDYKTAIYFANNGFSKLEVDKNHVVIAISKRETIHSLHRFINDNSEKIETMLKMLSYESPTISERDLRIYEIRKTTRRQFDKIADQIIQEFKLDDKDAEMNYDSAKTAYLRAKKHIAKLFALRKGKGGAC
jgi:hypothetical protein